MPIISLKARSESEGKESKKKKEGGFAVKNNFNLSQKPFKERRFEF
jgi:hypothetical protein